MKCQWSNINLGWCCGDIYTLSRDAINISIILDTKVSFEFNDVKVNVTNKSTVDFVADATLSAVELKLKAAFGEGW